MTWALNSNNPKRMLLLSLSLLGTVAVASNFSTAVAVDSVGSGYASKHGNAFDTVLATPEANGVKVKSSNVSRAIQIESGIDYLKRGSNYFTGTVNTASSFEFTRPNYFSGSVVGGVNVSTNFTTLPLKRGNFAVELVTASDSNGSKRAKGTYVSTLASTATLVGYVRYGNFFANAVHVSADLNTYSEVTYVRAACLQTRVVTPRVLTVSINERCGCKILLGQSVTIRCSVSDSEENLIDPTELTLTLGKPTGQRDSLGIEEVVRNSVGNYEFSFVPDQEGMYLVRWDTSESNYQGVTETSFFVRAGMLQ